MKQTRDHNGAFFYFLEVRIFDSENLVHLCTFPEPPLTSADPSKKFPDLIAASIWIIHTIHATLRFRGFPYLRFIMRI